VEFFKHAFQAADQEKISAEILAKFLKTRLKNLEAENHHSSSQILAKVRDRLI
jgi:hypothetical protein